MADLSVLRSIPLFRELVSKGTRAAVILEALRAQGVNDYSIDSIKRARSQMSREDGASPIRTSLPPPDPFEPPILRDPSRVVFVPDVHVPEHDADAVAAVLEFIRTFQPDRIYFLGDVIDNPQLSRFRSDPQRMLQLQDDLDATFDLLTLFRVRSPDAEIVWIEGNHEERLRKWLWDNPVMAQMRGLQPEVLFRCEELGIRYVRSNQDEEMCGWTITHGTLVRKWSGWSAKAEHEKHGTSGVSAHTHRAGVFSHSRANGSWTWIEAGCVCSLKPGYARHPDWQHAFAYATIDDGLVHARLAHILDGVALA